MPMGSIIKTVIYYEEPFWRKLGKMTTFIKMRHSEICLELNLIKPVYYLFNTENYCNKYIVDYHTTAKPRAIVVMIV
jgi:hypothetical protein